MLSYGENTILRGDLASLFRPTDPDLPAWKNPGGVRVGVAKTEAHINTTPCAPYIDSLEGNYDDNLM